jgi:predicted HicB family RNase H-like nuclease
MTMDQKAFARKLAAIPVEAPDTADLAMIEEAAAVNDGVTVSLEDLREQLDGYSGRILARVPRSLHQKLVESARAEGVSLNQYILYKLAK